LGYLLFATFRPYLSDLIWSAVLSYGLYPQYCRIVKLTGERRSPSAFLMSLEVPIDLVLPLVHLSFLTGKELASTSLNLVSLQEQRPGLIEEDLA